MPAQTKFKQELLNWTEMLDVKSRGETTDADTDAVFLPLPPSCLPVSGCPAALRSVIAPPLSPNLALF